MGLAPGTWGSDPGFLDVDQVTWGKSPARPGARGKDGAGPTRVTAGPWMLKEVALTVIKAAQMSTIVQHAISSLGQH